MSAKKSLKKIKLITNRIYLPHPVEIFIKVISWVVVIAIDLIEFILSPFMRIGAKCFAAFAIVATIFSGYTYLSYDLITSHAFFIFGAMLAAFLVFICAVRLIKYVLINVIRLPFANIIFAPVCISFRRPMFLSMIRNRQFMKLYAAEEAKESGVKENDNLQQVEHGDV